MMRYLAILAAVGLLLGGCATTIRSDVTAFHQWPARLQEKSYVFAPPAQEDTLEYRSYLGLVRAQLARLGFTEAASPEAANLKVALRFATVDHPLRVLEPIDPFWSGPGYWPGRYGFHRYPWGWGPWHGWPYEARETIRHAYERQLRITITDLRGKQLFDVSVQNTSEEAATPAVMPALVASAFAGFPGQSGVPHQVALTLK